MGLESLFTTEQRLIKMQGNQILCASDDFTAIVRWAETFLLFFINCKLQDKATNY
jgi:hypothetical protein